MSTQQIPKGVWGRSHKVDFYLMGEYQGTITKNEALAKITEYSKQEGFKVIPGRYTHTEMRSNYLLILGDEK